MAKMRKVQPEIQKMKDLYGDDRQKMAQEMQSLYKKEELKPVSYTHLPSPRDRQKSRMPSSA